MVKWITNEKSNYTFLMWNSENASNATFYTTIINKSKKTCLQIIINKNWHNSPSKLLSINKILNILAHRANRY